MVFNHNKYWQALGHPPGTSVHAGRAIQTSSGNEIEYEFHCMEDIKSWRLPKGMRLVFFGSLVFGKVY